jgi:uncharacterized membrane protein (Fun14 family)
MEQPVERGGLRSLVPLRSRTVRLGVLLSVAGLAAWIYGSAQEGDSGMAGRMGPWGMRLGISLAAGYVVGFLLRRARAKAFALLGALVAAAVALRYLGVLSDPAMQETMKDVAASAIDGANQVKGWVYGLLPDGVSAGVGGFLGMRGSRASDD